MFHPRSITPARETAELPVRFATFDHARRAFPNCDQTALRAFLRSEAARRVNAEVQPTGEIERYGDLLGIFFNVDALALASLRTRRWDRMRELIGCEAFQREVVERLIAEGKISAQVLA